MRVQFWVTRTSLLVLFMVFLGVMEARADIKLTDDLSLSGLLREELAVHTGGKNPTPGPWTTAERNSLNLSRTIFHTEWTYKPNDTFNLFSKVKMLWDQTAGLDDKLQAYDAFPLATPRYGSYLRATNDNAVDVEMSDLYADLSIGNLWLRLGKQQIVWGEVVAARILDQINPLDQSWHFQFEPEEFENIRISQWSVRARYNMPEGMIHALDDVYLEGYVNPGDVSANTLGVPGAPFQLQGAASIPGYTTLPIDDRRGYWEYGFRVGAKVGQFAGTLNYLSLYSKSGFTEARAGRPSFITYPQTDLYGVSLNYAFTGLLNSTVTYEATYSPDEPYYANLGPISPANNTVRTAHTLKQALLFGVSIPVLPRPISAMSVQFQYAETQIWDHDKIHIAGGAPGPTTNGGNNVSADQHILALVLSQDLFHNNLNLSFQAVYDIADAYYLKPGIKVRQGDHWIYDIYAVALGGADTRYNKFGYLSWANEIYGRITYQF